MTLPLSLFSANTPFSPDILLTGVSIDSRSIQKGELFAAFCGERVDGHDYIDKAVQMGCGAVLVERMPRIKPPVPVVVVDDVLKNLTEVAKVWRSRVNPLLVAVTGSCGKTTVKDMIYQIFKQQFTHVHATKGNYNNHIGLPLTILNMPFNCQALVLEMGMSAAGEIRFLTKVAKPNIGVITNIEAAHLASFSGLDAIADAKGELFEHLPEEGVAIVPFDQPHTSQLCQKAGKRTLFTFGLDEKADLHGHLNREGNFIIHGVDASDPLLTHLQGMGQHRLQNALAAAAVAKAAGVSGLSVSKGLRKFKTPEGRGRIQLCKQGWWVIDDTYNANPGSVQAALSAIPTPKGSGRKVAILGDMLELGEQAALLHGRLVEGVVKNGVTLLFTTGPLMKALKQAVSDHPHIQAWHQDDPSLWLETIASYLKPEDIILVKGSRGMKMERIVNHLVNNAL